MQEHAVLLSFRSFLRLSAAVFALLAFWCTCALAQTAGTGTITGTVSDPAGAVVPDATVVIHNTDTSSDRSVQSNEAGIYSATFLQPGPYQITVTKQGFTKIDRTGLTLEVGRTLAIDFALTVQAGTETVTITGEAPVVDADKTEVSQEVSQNLVSNLPIVGRRWDNFVFSRREPHRMAVWFLIAASQASITTTQVDGANNNQAFFSEARGRSSLPYTYSLDAIQEFQVSSSNYSAEFGQAAGGIVNAITKSGTNATHGDLFYFLRYPSLNALDPIKQVEQDLYATRTPAAAVRRHSSAEPSSRTSCSTS